MPRPCPEEFLADVITRWPAGATSRSEVARSFGVSDFCLARGLRTADREDGLAVSTSASSTTAVPHDREQEFRELRKKAQRLEQENKVRRRAAAYFTRDVLPNDLPAGP